MYYIGIDIGSTGAKGVLYKDDIICREIMPTGWNPKETGRNLYYKLLNDSNISEKDIENVVVTGYGRVAVDFADKVVTEITCHAKGGYYLNNSVRTIIDIGGQDSKVISLDSNGQVKDFIMNDKCAAGTGKFLEVTINSLGASLDEIDEITEGVEPVKINSMCTVFAESEIISLISAGKNKEEVAMGVINAIAEQGKNLLKKIKVKDIVLFTGGLAKSSVIKDTLSKKINENIITSRDSLYAGAIGAAVIASEL